MGCIVFIIGILYLLSGEILLGLALMFIGWAIGND